MRLFYLIKKEIIEILRQKELLVLTFLAPLLQIVILGYVITTDIRNIPVEIVNLSRSRAAHPIINRVASTPLFKVKRMQNFPDDYLGRLKRGDVKAIIIFRDPAAAGGNPLALPEVQVLVDGIDSNTSLIAAGYFNGIIKEYLLGEIGQLGRTLPVANRTVIRYNPRLRSINYMGPAIVALLLTILSIFITSASLVREREQQTMDTLLISRLTPLEIYVGKAVPAGLMGMINMVIGIVVVVFWFDIPIRGSLFFLFVAALIYISAILSFALLISTFSSTQQQALFFSWFSMITIMLMSGFLTPVENIPRGLRILADINPLRYLVKIVREIFLKGNGIEFFWQDLLILLAITLVVVSISLLNFKRFISK